jgi:hypothetical protein
MYSRKLVICLIACFLLVSIVPSIALATADGDGVIEPGENEKEELARAAQNPMANMISVPIQNNTNFKWGPLEKTQNVTNIQPVIPFNLTEDWVLISRTIAPIIYQPELVRGQGSEFGLGDINQSLFIGPSKPGSIIWGAGPIFLLPTATDKRLGTDKWGVGPAGVVLTMRGPWVFGALAQNIWSFAGDSDRDDVNQFLLQPFVNYNLGDGLAIGSSPIITANWKAESGEKWTVPIGVQVSKVMSIGKMPINWILGGYYNIEKPDNLGPDWTLRFQVNFMLPKGRK